MKKRINYLFAAGIMLSAAVVFTSCKKTSSDPGLPPIGGYNSSDDVASTNLMAKWSFENSLTESKQGLVGTGTNVAYTTGKKGQAWQGSSSQARYAIYNTGTIPSMTSYSIAFWMNSDSAKLPLAVPTQGYGAQGILSLVDATSFWGGINLMLENRSPADGDTMRIKMFTNNKRTGVVWAGQSPVIRIPGALKQWIHIVLTYDEGTGRYSAYVNGALGGKMEVPYGPVFGGTVIEYANDPGSINNVNNAPIQGAIVFPASTQLVIGAFQFNTTPPLNAGGTQQPWATTFAGLLDEMRIYKSALSASDVSALYQLELAGR